jgi:type IV secretory pathway TrbD component
MSHALFLTTGTKGGFIIFRAQDYTIAEFGGSIAMAGELSLRSTYEVDPLNSDEIHNARLFFLYNQ